MKQDVYVHLRELNLELPAPPSVGGLYTPAMPFGENLLYMSGVGPNIPGRTQYFGKVGKDLTIAQGQEAARAAALNLLANLQAAVGDLNRVKRIVKVLGFVSCGQDFYEQPQVINGASALFIDLFGEMGRAARSAVGMAALPGNIPVEVEALVELEE
jgi:enamine deaminase RidA (YjgF/YER057c/UK114 family)